MVKETSYQSQLFPVTFDQHDMKASKMVSQHLWSSFLPQYSWYFRDSISSCDIAHLYRGAYLDWPVTPIITPKGVNSWTTFSINTVTCQKCINKKSIFNNSKYPLSKCNGSDCKGMNSELKVLGSIPGWGKKSEK